MEEKELVGGYRANAILVLLITVLFTGVNGLIAFILFIAFSKLNLGRDPLNKHGLAEGNSRLGGVAIIISIAIGCCSHLSFQKELSLSLLLIEISPLIIFSLAIGIIGLIEDLSQNIDSMFRLYSMLLIVSIGLYFSPELIPVKLISSEFIGTNHFILTYIFTVIMVCGFVNAGNMADGANGLLASIILAFFVVLYSIDQSILNFSIVISLLAFIIFNTSTGKIFLGDFGAYFLSSLVALKSLELYSKQDISVFFLASILIYPCFELTRSLLIRTMRSVSVLTPDNDHLHNYLHSLIVTNGFKKHISNSITGLGIALFTTIIPVILYFTGISVNSELWKTLFLIKFTTLTFIYILFEKKSRDN